MTQTRQSQKHLSDSERFVSPDTEPTHRIDELIPSSPEWAKQTGWLKATLTKHWPSHLPQPFIGFDDAEDAFVLQWHSHDECNVLTVNAHTHRGSYDPWPEKTQNPALDELDLDSETAWQRLKTALTTTPM